METATQNIIRARVTVYMLARLRVAQVCLPIGVITTTIARHSSAPVIVSMAAVAFVATVVSFSRAIRTNGGQRITANEDSLLLGEKSREIHRADVRRWIFVRNVAWLYCNEISYRLRVRPADGPALEKCLTGLLGGPEPIKYRGSPRARLIAFCVAVIGLALVVYAFTIHESLPFIFVGVPSFILGLATFAALSQRVIQAT
jgi:hypothetical protein